VTAPLAEEAPAPVKAGPTLVGGRRRFPVTELATTAAAIVLALLVGAILIVVADPQILAQYGYFFAAPGDALSASFSKIGHAYAALGAGAFGGWDATANTLVESTPLICSGLAVALAFQAGLFNIGGQGQAILGALVSGFLGFQLHLPPGLHLVVCLVGGMAAGAVWGGVSGALKSYTGAHEVITTIMLNYVGGALLAWGLITSLLQRPGRTDAISPVVDANAQLPAVGGVHLGFVLSLAAAAGVSLLLSRTTTGFRLRTVGANPDAARTAGMSVSTAVTVAMLLSGALAGLAGAQYTLGQQLPLTDGVVGNVGFDGITVALLGRGSPLGTVFAGILFGALNAGGRHMQIVAQTPLTLSIVLQAVIVLFVAAPALVRQIVRIRGRDAAEGTVLAKGWGS
jgi:ABC-type uncharacterized transport system permease subunit